MELSNIIFPAIAAISIFIIYMLVVTAVGRKDSVKERVHRLSASGDEITEDSAEALLPDIDVTGDSKRRSSLAVALEPILRIVGANPERFRKENQLRFYRAGMTSPDVPVLYLAAKIIGLPVAILIAVSLITSDASGSMKALNYFGAFMIAILGIFGPNLYVTNSLQKRQKRLQRSFPDALDLLLVCVESGLALDGALARVCKELHNAHPEVSEELNRTRLELTLLNDRERALMNLAERTDLVPFRSLVASLLQTEKFGTSLTDTLRVLSEDYRTHRLLAAEEKAGRLPVLMTLPLITLMMPAFFLIVLGPAIINVIEVFSNR